MINYCYFYLFCFFAVCLFLFFVFFCCLLFFLLNYLLRWSEWTCQYSEDLSHYQMPQSALALVPTKMNKISVDHQHRLSKHTASQRTFSWARYSSVLRRFLSSISAKTPCWQAHKLRRHGNMMQSNLILSLGLWHPRNLLSVLGDNLYFSEFCKIYNLWNLFCTVMLQLLIDDDSSNNHCNSIETIIKIIRIFKMLITLWILQCC